MRLLLLAFVLSACSYDSYIVKSDMGGELPEYEERFEEYEKENKQVEIRGTCASACTMFLGLDNICVSKNARLGFHGSMVNGNIWYRPGTELLSSYYTPRLKEWFWSNAAFLYDEDIVWLSGEQVSKLNNTRIC